MVPIETTLVGMVTAGNAKQYAKAKGPGDSSSYIAN